MNVKLLRKFIFCGHVYFQAVCPESINQTLLYLKKCNLFDQDITINMINIADNLRDLTDSVTYNFHESLDLEENIHLQVTMSVVYTGECSQSQYFIN